MTKRHWKFSIEKGSNKINLCDTRKRDRDIEGSIVFKPVALKGKKINVCSMCRTIGESMLRPEKS